MAHDPCASNKVLLHFREPPPVSAFPLFPSTVIVWVTTYSIPVPSTPDKTAIELDVSQPLILQLIVSADLILRLRALYKFS